MGVILSPPNPSSHIPTSTTTTSTAAAAMSSSNSTPPETAEPKSPIPETLDPPTDPNPAQNDAGSEETPEQLIEADDEEEEGECGFCLFMKAGGCKETFTDWEKCVEEGEKNKEDIVEKCFQVTSNLKKCMEEHSDYYAPLLQAEEEAAKQLEEEKVNNRESSTEESKKEES